MAKSYKSIFKLQFQSEKAQSLKQKISIISLYMICFLGALYITYFERIDAKQLFSNERPILLLACVIIYIIRAAITLFVFVYRKISWWETVWGGSIIGVILFLFLRFGLMETQSLGIVDFAGILIYLIGSYIGTVSEYLRHTWKSRPENQDHIYTQGLFIYARHINYFGDILLFSGLAILTRQVWTVFIPLGMGLNFILIIIPAHDAYLASRYGGEYSDYERRTKKLIPFIY